MTARKTQTAAPSPSPKSIPIPYPPAAIWKTKEQGVQFEFRGNTFVRHGVHVTRLVTEEAAPATSAEPQKRG